MCVNSINFKGTKSGFEVFFLNAIIVMFSGNLSIPAEEPLQDVNILTCGIVILEYESSVKRK